MAWQVAIVAQHGHRIVERELARLGIGAFYPRLRRWVTHARTKVAVERPLLGPYVFAEIAGGGFALIERITELQAVLGEIEDEIVWSWRRRYMAGEFDLTVRDVPVDALVMLTEGEFAGVLARITKVTRDKVSVELRGSRRVVTTQRRNITAA